MKTIIAGSRDLHDKNEVEAAINDSGFTITEVVSGKARGVDKLGEDWAEQNGIPVKPFPANWNKHGKAAGPIRNSEMARYAEACIVIKYPNSRGSEDMATKAKNAGLKLHVREVKR